MHSSNDLARTTRTPGFFMAAVTSTFFSNLILSTKS